MWSKAAVVAGWLSAAALTASAAQAVEINVIASTAMREVLEELVPAGKVVANTRVDFVRSGAGVAVRAGAPKPDIGTPEALKKALLAAKSVGYSQGPSGVHFMDVLTRLG